MFLLDTNVISELRRAADGRANPLVIAWQSGVPSSDFFVSAITLMELEQGILLIERRDTAQGIMLRNWMTKLVLPEFANRTLVVDTAIALRCAALHVPNPRADRDALIAATALVHGLTLVTRNVADFQTTGVTLLNPWQHSA